MNDRGNYDFECPALSPELRGQIDQIMARRQMLLSVDPDSDEIGELLIIAEKISQEWWKCCEKEWREEREGAPSHAAGLLNEPAIATAPSLRLTAEDRNEAEPQLTGAPEHMDDPLEDLMESALPSTPVIDTRAELAALLLEEADPVERGRLASQLRKLPAAVLPSTRTELLALLESSTDPLERGRIANQLQKIR
jgi:hypothetical protein